MPIRAKQWLINFAAPVVLVALFVGGMILPSRRGLLSTHFRFHPVTGESERQRLWFGLVISREREQLFAWYAENCGGKHAADDDPLWRTGDGGTIYGGVRVWLQGLMEAMETCQVPLQDRCTVIRYQLEHPAEPVWCEVGPEHESLQWGTAKGIVLRWQKGKPVEAVGE